MCMCKRIAFAVSALALCFSPAARAAKIIWVSDNKTPAAGIPADQGWVDLLRAQGHTVDYTNTAVNTGYWNNIDADATKLAALNAADLIIVSRDLNSGSYVSNATETTQWNNGIKKPLLLLMAHMARNDRWQWAETADQADAMPTLQAVKLDHPIFRGVTLNASNQVSVLTRNSSISNATSAGNGTVIATRADNGRVWIAEWQAGQVFKPTGTQTAGGQRLLFAAGGIGPDGIYNLTADGQKMFRNAVRYLLGEMSLFPAKDPNPADQAPDVPRDVTLAWTAGKYAATHDVYLGRSATDVTNASRTNTLGVLASQGLTESGYAPAGLEFGKTYYWRVDEVNAPPSTAISKGDVWTFTVERFAYPIPNVKATASSAVEGDGPEKTVDNSGLTVNAADPNRDTHSTDTTAMWLSTGVLPNQIQYEFDKVYKLYELWVWNYNQANEKLIGFGARSVKIEYSADGSTWTELAGVPEFTQATGAATYTHNTTVSFGGVMAKYVKLTINTTWNGGNICGLSEVRFSYVPTQARLPQPANAATSQAVTTILNWRPGRTATSHQVYVGTDPNAVTNGTAAVKTVTDHTFDPGVLLYGATYYWKVDEVNTVTDPGDVWSFSTEAFGVVDNFESYTDQTGSAMFETWMDGYNTPTTNGSTVGNTDPTKPIAETTIVHGGRQSMPFSYDNTKASRSEATRTFTLAPDWTLSGIKSLSLWLQGVPTNTGGQLYVKINNVKVPYNGPASDLTRTAWVPWNIDLSTVTGLSKVTTLTIGVEGAGVQGKLYFDDIRLYPNSPVYAVPVDPGKTNIAALWALDGDAKDSSGHNLNGTVKLGTFVASGRTGGGQALQLQQVGYVDLGNPSSLDFATGGWTVTAWFKTSMSGGVDDPHQGVIYGKGGDNTGGKRYALNMSLNTEGVLTLVVDDDTTRYDAKSQTKTNDDQWHFVAAERDGTVLRIFIDGLLEGTTTIPATYDLSGSSQRNAYIGAMTYQPDGTIYKLFNGLIDEVHIYNRALSAGEVAYLAGLTTPVALPF
jgi:hypothetical protein